MAVVENWDHLKEIRMSLKQKQLKVVFTNGVFDIVHRGHVDYLQKARDLGDILIVGLNSDASVKQIKGDLRPLVPASDRAFVLSALRCVDYVTFFEETTPLHLIEKLQPDVLVKGGDWAIDQIVGRSVVEAAGGTVRTIPYLQGHSTTRLIEKILSSHA